MVGILAAFAQMERESIRMRMMMGKEAAARRGKWPGGGVPTGYRVAQDGGLEPDPQYADAVRELFRLSARGYGVRASARLVMERYGVSLAAGAEVNLIKIIRNPIYKGTLAYNGMATAGVHEPLVTEEEWQAAVAALDRRSEALPARRKVGVLTGIIWCGRCGARMSVKKVRQRPRQYVCYSVSKANRSMIRDPACTNKAVHYVEDVDKAVLDAIGSLAADPSALDGMAAKKDEPEAEAGRIRERLAEVARQSARILDLYQAGGASMDDVRPRLEALQAERAALARRLADAEAVRAKEEAVMSEARDALGAWRELADGGTYEERVALVRALIDRVVIDGEDVTVYWRFSPDKSLNNSWL
jgi:site-specific DNA recombinase